MCTCWAQSHLESDSNMTGRPTFAGWLFRPVPIFLTKNLEASFKCKVSIAAILDGFHVIIISLVIAWHVASVDVLWWRARHYCKVNNLACSLSDLYKSTSVVLCQVLKTKQFILLKWQENLNTFSFAFILRHSGILLQVPLAVHSALSSPISTYGGRHLKVPRTP